MQTHNSKLYGEIREPESFVELMELIAYSTRNKFPYMWRGQSNINWRIDHSAFRRLKMDKEKITEENLINYEENLLTQATHKGYRNQEGRVLSDFELLAKLQHHGAATRLLDFSRNALVALWFCVIENITETGLLFGIHSHHLGGYESEDLNEDYKSHIKGIMKIKHPQTWEPPVLTNRIAAQHSQFIYSSLSTDKRASICLDSSPSANFFIAISPKLKSELIIILEQTFDIRQLTLFPDIDGFGVANNTKIGTNKMWRY